MAELIYFSPVSLDGYIADEPSKFGWSLPDEEVFAFINDLMRPIGTYLYGRGMYQTMAVWETPAAIPNPLPGMPEFARIWQAAEKIVYSRTLDAVSTPRTRLEREFDPQAIRDLKARSARDITIGGPTLARQAIRDGLVDEYRLLVVPAMIGGGRQVLGGGPFTQVDLLDERRFAGGTVYLRYRMRAQ